jgi:hypothetical protein
MKNNKKFLDVLIDIRYHDSMNKFEEIYGEGIPYRRMEQDTYVELKSMTLALLGRKIKYKKCRDLEKESDPMVLTVNAEMTDDEYHEFVYLHNQGEFTFLYDFIVSKIRISEEQNEQE